MWTRKRVIPMATRRTHAQRVEQGRAKFLAAHPGASNVEANAFARGHWRTPEHGYLKQSTGSQSALFEVYRAGDVKRMLGTIADEYGDKARITLTVHDLRGRRVRQFFRNPGREWGAGGGVRAEHAREVLWRYTPDFARAIAVLLSGKRENYNNEKIKLKVRQVTVIQIAVIIPTERTKPSQAA